MKKFITYRLAGVGVWHYEFCLNGEPFGSVDSRVSRTEPARIEGPGISWYSHFDMDRDIVPGVSRQVKDSRAGEEIYRIIRWQPDGRVDMPLARHIPHGTRRAAFPHRALCKADCALSVPVYADINLRAY